MGLTLDQQKALAVASARARAAGTTPSATPAPDNSPQSYAGAFGSGMADGIPIVGPYVDRATNAYVAGVSSLVNGTSYDDELKKLEGKLAADDAAHPNVKTAGEVAGAVAGTVPMVMAAPAAFGANGGPLIARTAASAGSGAAVGGADAAVRSGGDLRATGTGAGVGLTFGVGAPMAGRMLGNAGQAAMEYFQRPGGALSGVSSPAARFASETFLDPAYRARMGAELGRLGPDAMLADVSPDWQMVARGAATRPGSRDQVLTPLLERGQSKNIRLGADLDASLGPAPVPSFIDDAIAQNQAQVGQQYGPIVGRAAPVDTTALAQGLDATRAQVRGPAQRAVGNVRGMLNEVGGEGLDTNAGTLLQTRQAIDGMLATETDPNAVRNLTMARQQVDAELARAAPGIKAVDADYAELARQREGLQTGSRVLDSGKTTLRPAELDQQFRASALPQGEQIGPSGVPLRIQQGARAEIDRIVGQNANDPAALQRLMRGEGDWNRDKLATVYGSRRADAALNAIDRETQFYRTQNRVTGGSDTAPAQRFGDFLDQAAKPGEIPTGTTATGVVMNLLQKAGRRILDEDGERAARRFAQELGRMSVAQGGSRDAIVSALIDHMNRTSGARSASKSVEYVTNALLRAGGPAALSLEGPR